MYSYIGKKHPLEWASTILAIIALFVTAPVYYFYKKGPEIRMKSKFAQKVAKEREKNLQKRNKGRAGAQHEKRTEGGTAADVGLPEP